MITWIIGRGGLLGSAVARESRREFLADAVPWQNPTAASLALAHQAQAFRAHVGHEPWAVIWAAGAATTATSATSSMEELEPLRGVLQGLRECPPAGPGTFFLTSSAGGVYAGSTGAPFDRHSPTAPLSPYGELKMAQEGLAAGLLRGVCPLLVGRISNLYGPGQNLEKLQGLISRLALAAVSRQPITMFVPLDTIRDYLFVDDAARALLSSVARSLDEQPQEPEIEIIASGTPVTIGQVIQTMHHVAKRRVPIALGTHHSAAAQAPDMRVIPTFPIRQLTPLPAGMKAVYLDILDRLQHPGGRR